jgi:hypothetical protein
MLGIRIHDIGQDRCPRQAPSERAKGRAWNGGGESMPRRAYSGGGGETMSHRLVLH